MDPMRSRTEVNVEFEEKSCGMKPLLSSLYRYSHRDLPTYSLFDK